MELIKRSLEDLVQIIFVIYKYHILKVLVFYFYR